MINGEECGKRNRANRDQACFGLDNPICQASRHSSLDSMKSLGASLPLTFSPQVPVFHKGEEKAGGGLSG